MAPAAPFIDVVWGTVTTPWGTFKDAVVTRDGATAWDWAADNFHHTPGYTESFLARFASVPVDVLLLSAGMDNKVRCAFAVQTDPRVQYLNTAAIPAAYATAVAAGKRVIAYVHSTC
jgi:hypothetical protein